VELGAVSDRGAVTVGSREELGFHRERCREECSAETRAASRVPGGRTLLPALQTPARDPAPLLGAAGPGELLGKPGSGWVSREERSRCSGVLSDLLWFRL